MSHTISPCENCREETCYPERGCPDWRKWFVKNWNKNIHRRRPEWENREVIRYEHPDRVRELAPKKEEEMNAAEWMAKQMEVSDAK